MDDDAAAISASDGSQFNLTSASASFNATASSTMRIDPRFMNNPMLAPVGFGGHQRQQQQQQQQKKKKRQAAKERAQHRRARGSKRGAGANGLRSKSSLEIRQESSAQLMSMSGTFPAPQYHVPQYHGAGPAMLPPMQMQPVMTGSAPNAGLWNNAAGLPTAQDSADSNGSHPANNSNPDPGWRKVARVPSAELVALIFTTVSSNLKSFTKKQLKHSPFGEALSMVWIEIDHKMDVQIDATEWRRYTDDIANSLGSGFRRFLVDMVWESGVDVAHLLNGGAGGHAVLPVGRVAAAAPVAPPQRPMQHVVPLRNDEPWRQPPAITVGEQRHQAATRVQAVHRGNTGRKKHQAKRDAHTEETSDIYAHGDYQLDYGECK